MDSGLAPSARPGKTALCATSLPTSPVSELVTPRTGASVRARPLSCSMSRRSRRLTSAAADPERAKQPCSIQRKPLRASMPSRCQVVPRLALIRLPACRLGCGNRAAASPCGLRGFRSCPPPSCLIFWPPATRPGAGSPLPRTRLRGGGGGRRRVCPRQRRRRRGSDNSQLQRRNWLSLGTNAARPHRRRVGRD